MLKNLDRLDVEGRSFALMLSFCVMANVMKVMAISLNCEKSVPLRIPIHELD